MLRVDICAMKRFEQVDPQQELRQQIQQRKQAIYAYRNRLLSEILGQPVTALSFAYTCHGKPYLKEHNLAINHTHSKKIYALVTSSEQQDIGIDVEDLERQVRLDALAQHAFHEEEYQTWKSMDKDRLYWFKVWTAKEAILKASGLGIRLSLKDINTRVHPMYDNSQMQHESLGYFAYQHFEVAQSLITIAWRTGQGCGEFIFPRIQIYRH